MSPEIAKFLEVIIGIVVLVAVPVAGYAAVVATRAIWAKGEPRAMDDTAQLREELEQLRQRVAELESVPERMTELEERVDFSERLLTRQREVDRLPGGES